MPDILVPLGILALIVGPCVAVGVAQERAWRRGRGYPGSGDRARVRPPSPVPSVSLTAPRAPRDTPPDRIAAVLADLEHVARLAKRTHSHDCWRWHADCLAARVARTLRGER